MGQSGARPEYRKTGVPSTDYRRALLLEFLREPARGAMSAWDLAYRFGPYRDRLGPDNMARSDLAALEKQGLVRRLDTKPLRWEAC